MQEAGFGQPLEVGRVEGSAGLAFGSLLPPFLGDVRRLTGQLSPRDGHDGKGRTGHIRRLRAAVFVRTAWLAGLARDDRLEAPVRMIGLEVLEPVRALEQRQ